MSLENFERRTFEIVRMDTGQIIDSVPMSESEYNDARQEKLPLAEVVKINRNEEHSA